MYICVQYLGFIVYIRMSVKFRSLTTSPARSLLHFLYSNHHQQCQFSVFASHLVKPAPNEKKKVVGIPLHSVNKRGTAYRQSRGFFKLPGGLDLGNKRKDYAERRLLGYSMEQMFKVVAEVEHYKNFVPYCKQSIVTLRTPGHLRADLVVGFPPLVESYTSSVTLTRPNLIKSVCTEGKLFNHLLTIWKFSPGIKGNPQTCLLDFSVSFEFRSALHSNLSHMFFDKVVVQMVNAFLVEAKRRYGQPSIAGQRPQIVSQHS